MELIDTIGNWFNTSVTYAGNAWDSAINQLKDKAREFISVFAWLKQHEATAMREPDLRGEYVSTMQKGAMIKTSVEKTTGGIDWINGKLTKVGGTMQALPAIPIALTVATILGLVAAMSYWLNDAYQLKTKIDYIEKHGITGQSAQDILTGGNTKQLLIGAGVVALIAYFLRGD